MSAFLLIVGIIIAIVAAFFLFGNVEASPWIPNIWIWIIRDRGDRSSGTVFRDRYDTASSERPRLNASPKVLIELLPPDSNRDDREVSHPSSTTRPTVPTAASPSESGSGLSVHVPRFDDGLLPINSRETKNRLAQKNRVSGAWDASKEIGDNVRTFDIQNSAHAVNIARAKQANEIITEALQFGEKQQEIELLPLTKEKKASGLRADIAENELREIQAKTAAQAVLKPPPPPEPPPKSKHVDPLAEMERRWRAELERGAVGVRSIYEKLKAEAEAKYKNNPAQLKAHMDMLERLKEKEVMKS